jgi:signal peptidase I
MPAGGFGPAPYRTHLPGSSGARRELLRGLAEIPLVVGLAVLIVVILRAVLVQPYYIPSASMVPQLRVNDKILVSRLSYRLHGIHRGDLVVFSEPPGVHITGGAHSGLLQDVGKDLGLVPRSDVLVKRVIGLPGDTVEGHDGHIYVNGRLLLEPYLPPSQIAVTPDFPLAHVPKGDLWVMGDNRQNSYDSKFFGPIKESSVLGRAFIRIWPLDKISFL